MTKKLVKQYEGKVTFQVAIETLGDPDDVVNKLLDLLGAVKTSEIGVSWDDCEWELQETCFACGTKGEVIVYDGNGLQMEITCPDCGEEN
jgi:hypothetical protein